MAEKYLTAYVYRNACLGDSTNNGITARFDEVAFKHPQGFLSNPGNRPVVVLKDKFDGDYVYAKPADAGNVWTMFGGNFIYSSDSRFPSRQPIPVHDRIEVK